MLPFVILFFLIFLVFFYIIKVFFLYLQSQVKPITYVNPVFGIVKKPFIKDATSEASLNVVLDTIQGQAVTATETAKVYFIPPTTPRFGYRQKAFLMAKTLGFDTEAAKYKLIDKIATFEDQRSRLKIDISNFNFSYEYDFTQDEELFSGAYIPSQREIENKAIDLLKAVGRYPDELARGKTSARYFLYQPADKALIPVKRPQEANVVEIDFYRPNIDEFDIVSERFFSSQNYVVMVFRQNESKIIKTQVQFFEKSDEQVGVYGLKTGDKAFDDLKSGKNLIVSGSSRTGEVKIKTMFLGYLDPSTYQEYLQPVYVFLGEGDFVAYVSAVVDQYSAD